MQNSSAFSNWRMHSGSVNVYAACVLISLFIVLMIQGLMR
jgi:hypothetical protein